MSSSAQQLHTRHIFLADDDNDDCLLFKDALDELQLPVGLTTLPNGEELMHCLNSIDELPDMLFLDLNMPRKNGVDCLIEIKNNEKLRRLSVIIFSTSFQQVVADQLYDGGARYYIRKPSDFTQLKNVIYKVLMIINDDHSVSPDGNYTQPMKADFVLS